MFKFATNKFNVGGGGGGGSNQNSGQSHPHASRLDDNAQGANAASRRRQLQKDLFAYNKIADKGFPSKPSAMDYDKKLKLLALGTKNGDIRIYGAPGTQQQQLSCYQDVHPFPIQRILFIQGQHQLITLSERVHRNDQTNKGESLLYLVLWQIPSDQKQSHHQSNLVEKIKEYQLDPKAINGSKLSAMTLLNDNSHLFLGFESGDVYVFNVSAFQLVPGVINKDYILKNLPEGNQSNKKLTSLGAVESICHHPRQLTKLLLAYQRGLWVIFDFIKNQIDQINQTQQQLESAIFYQAGECVATAHSDGSFILWDLENNLSNSVTNNDNSPATSANTIPSCSSNSAPNIVYGPYPCKPVQKCLVKTCRNDQPYVIFSGGCPRVNYSDKVTISVIQGENQHICFDFTSKIIDYFTIDKPTLEKPNLTYDNPQALFVLLEEEFVAIDLTTEGWPQFKLPYLYSVHSSAIICTHYVNNVSKKFYECLKYYGVLSQEPNELFSDKEWPVGGCVGSPVLPANKGKDILLTGHEDGTIRFWDVTQMSMTLIYRLKTSDYFQTESTPLDDEQDSSGCDNTHGSSNEDNWPPFRKVGTFDPYSDDPKLGIQKLYLCPVREILVIAGTAGQVLVMNINDQARDLLSSSIQCQKINLIGVSPEVESHFVWKGHEPLQTRSPSATIKLNAGYQLHTLIQLYPPATVSALALNTDWQLVSMGTSHGFALFDYLQNKPLLIRCTLDPAMLLASQNPNDSGGNMISRRKSLKKSLRESFRKLRRGRSQKNTNARTNNNATMLTRLNQLPNSNQMRVEHIDGDDMNHKPIERQVESREFKPMDDIPPSVIRYMYFVRTFITSSQQQTNSLWVGTNTGIIYIYALQFQTPQQTNKFQARTNQTINCLLAKEMRLKHRAPVVHIQVIDQNMYPLPSIESTQVQSDTAITPQTNHKVIICSEEQFKVFQLPTLKPVCKFKLTAVEGARVRRIGYNSYTSRSDPKYSEYCLSCLSNLGDLSVYSLPQLKRQVQIQCMKQQDINAITSFVFSKQGQAFYLQSPSEFVHISMSARDTPQQIMLQNTSIKPATRTSNVSPKKQQKPVNNNNKPVVAAGQNNESIPSSNLNSSPENTTNNSNSNTNKSITSPTSPPPPVPAPRTTILNKDEPVNSNTSNRQNTNTLTKQDSFENKTNACSQNQKNTDYKPLNKEPITISTSSLKPNNANPITMQHSTPSAKNTMNIDASPIKSDEVNKRTTSESMSNHDSKIDEHNQSNCNEKLDTDQKKITPHKESTTPTPTINTNLTNISEVINASSTTTSGVSLGSAFNQSSISSSTVSHTSHTANPSHQQANLNNNNISMITNTQNDSFNVSSSGYNGSSSCAGMSGVVDLSMDSVVDRFNDEFNDLSTRKIQPAIDENDSLLNESNHALDVNRINLNENSQSSGGKTSTLNGNQSRAINPTGQVNYTFTSDNLINSSFSSRKTTNGHLRDDTDITEIPQKASSPLNKLNGINQRISNKNEQVTKRIIENGSKPEYRETVID